jgi:hypothetical protein
MAERVGQEQEHHRRDHHRSGQRRPEQRRTGPPVPPRRTARTARAATSAGSARAARSRRPTRPGRRQRAPRRIEGRPLRLRIGLRLRIERRRGRPSRLLIRGLLVRRRWVRRGRGGRRLVGRGLEGRPGSGVRVPVAPVIARRRYRGGRWQPRRGRQRRRLIGRRRRSAKQRVQSGRRCRCRRRRRRRERRARHGEPRAVAVGRLRPSPRPRLDPGPRPGAAACQRFLRDNALPAARAEPRTSAHLRPAPAAPAAQLFHSTTAPPFPLRVGACPAAAKSPGAPGPCCPAWLRGGCSPAVLCGCDAAASIRRPSVDGAPLTCADVPPGAGHASWPQTIV